MTFSVSFDTKSLSEIAQLAGFQALLTPQVQTALQQAADILTQAAQQNTWTVFANPSGALADSLHAVYDSPYESQVGSDLPYAHRREMGFSGVDSLGRTYNDPPYYYLTNAMNDNQQQILQLIDDAVARALTQLGAV